MTQQMNILDYTPEPDKEPVKAANQEQEIIEADHVSVQNESSSTEIAIVDTSPKNAIAIFSNKGLDPLIEQIKQRVKSEKFDVTTQKGRERIGSVARQIGSAKMRLVEMADSLTEDSKKMIAAINEEKKRAVLEFDTLRDEVLAPRLAYEQIEKDRQAEHEKHLNTLEGMIEFAYHEQYTVEQMENALAKSSELFSGRQWQEYADRANYANLKNKDKLTQAIAKRKEHDEAAAEAERVAQAARDKEIEDAKIAAAEKAKKDAEEAAAAEAKRIADKVEADRIEAERVAKEKADADAAEIVRIQKQKQDADEKRVYWIKESIHLLELPKGYETFSFDVVQGYINRHNAFFGEKNEAKSFEEFYDLALETYNATLEKLKARLSAAESEEKKARDKAIQEQKERDAKIAKDAADAEAVRQQKIKDDEAAAQKKRDDDLEHRKKINNEAKDDISKIVEEYLASDQLVKNLDQLLVEAIVLGHIRNVSIKY